MTDQRKSLHARTQAATRTLLITLAVCAVIDALGLSRASAQDSTVPPPRAVTQIEETRPNVPLLVGGLAVIAATYIPPVIVAASSDVDGDDFLFIPIAGPWMDLAARDDCSGACDGEDAYRMLLISIGITHVVGTALVVSSFLVPERRMSQTMLSTVVLPTPMGKRGAGLVLINRF